jgi:nicotinamide phosphoribosyltransferase
MNTNNSIVNLILSTDSYKLSHHKFYPEGTQYVFSYGEPRAGGEYKNAQFIGMAAFVDTYLANPITQDDLDEAVRILGNHVSGFNVAGWEYIIDVHNGYMPVSIKAVAEGSKIPINNALFTIVNTDPNCAWVTSYLETALLRAIWYPTTVASKIAEIRDVLIKSLMDTTGSTYGLEYMLHDFGARGGSSGESVSLASMAHQMFFEGTDSIEGLVAVDRFYNELSTATSIDATEHSIMTAKMREGEFDQLINVLANCEDGDMLACVADSYNIYRFCQSLRDPKVFNTIVNKAGRFIVRPDSGVPELVVVQVLRELEQVFGTTENDKGYKVLNSNVGVIQGDGLSTVDDFKRIIDAVKDAGFSMENLAFGMGGGIHQILNRDTMRWAMKCSARQGLDIDTIDGWMDIFKDPIHGGKTSKKGRLSLFANRDGKPGSIRTHRIDENDSPVGWTDYTDMQDLLLSYYYFDSKIDVPLIRKDSFTKVKGRARG